MPDMPAFTAPPPEATIVRQVAVPDTGDMIEDKVVARPSSGSQLKVEGESEEERRARKLTLLLDISQALSRHQDVDRLLEKVEADTSLSPLPAVLYRNASRF
jgi:hypothetical protein